jgi:hypothetical protein
MDARPDSNHRTPVFNRRDLARDFSRIGQLYPNLATSPHRLKGKASNS